MTESTKDDFGSVVNTLTDRTVKLDKPPFVALLERTEEGGPWSETCLLQSNKRKLEKLLGSYGDIGATTGDTGATAPVTPPKIKEHSKTKKQPRRNPLTSITKGLSKKLAPKKGKKKA